MEENKKKTAPQKPAHKLSKVGQWLRSDNPPLFDLSGLSKKEKEKMMRLILK